MKPVYIITGIPGSGKDTQAKLLAKKLNFPHLDPGTIFINIIRNKEKHWESLAAAFAQKMPVPTEDFIEIMSQKFNEEEYKDGFVLSQNTKSVEEVKLMMGVMKDLGFEIKRVFYLNISTEEAIHRAMLRLNGQFSEKEPDEASVRQRIMNYDALIHDIADYYRSINLLIDIDGTKSIDEIFEKICKEINMD
jgi:adenylate kinase